MEAGGKMLTTLLQGRPYDAARNVLALNRDAGPRQLRVAGRAALVPVVGRELDTDPDQAKYVVALALEAVHSEGTIRGMAQAIAHTIMRHHPATLAARGFVAAPGFAEVVASERTLPDTGKEIFGRISNRMRACGQYPV